MSAASQYQHYRYLSTLHYQHYSYFLIHFIALLLGGNPSLRLVNEVSQSFWSFGAVSVKSLRPWSSIGINLPTKEGFLVPLTTLITSQKMDGNKSLE